ncbi:MAG: acyl-CoA dehydrogenase family protein [Alphaproteobacteria bacterium]|jgi:alkylation response protein AidB-like acyl-CoA dehydrogenase|uniref:acyl-CoA dehydrogenase family protein n=1 Tax=Pacificispira sp. TaxID=2888761 RepID=UPI001B2BE7BB|nr:acyl-CoA dehydrogenase family protein [Alphaproteobacteria bacterium]MBO6864699.1 acyl-CoA dehydrogenase family protein [Alphaproteobacteria bacterium]MEC9267449.1 acyl-CoA dehydrogenase family protein [Pseudomonadota bacterium]
MILNEEQQMIRDMARQFAQERLVPNAEEWDREARFPKEALDEMAQLGMLGMMVPPEWDGAGTDCVSYAMALEEIAAGDGAVSAIMSVHNSVGCMPILRYGTDEQKEKYLKPFARGEMIGCFCLTEPQAGSDASALKTTARRDGNKWVIDGAKQFITNGSSAGLAIVFAVTDPDAGKRGISAFLVPTDSEGYIVERVEKKMGLNASDTCALRFEGVEVTPDMMLGEEGQGYKIALSNLEGGRIGIAAQALGIAQAALNYAVEYAKDRTSMGQPIMNHQAVGFRLADGAAKLQAARQLILHAAAMKDAGIPCLTEASMAKLFATETAETVVSDALQTFGGYGYMKDYPLERLARDVRVTKIYEGTSDIQRMLIARSLAA